MTRVLDYGLHRFVLDAKQIISNLFSAVRLKHNVLRHYITYLLNQRVRLVIF